MNKKIMPPTYFIVLLFSSIGLHFLFPVMRLISLPYNYLGILIIIFGIILNLWTDSLFKKRQTTVKPHEMPNFFISSGPFRISRHPMYLGMTLILLGVAVFFGSLISFVFPIIFVMIMEKLFIPMEEKNLEKEFGDKYIAYKKRVRKWI